MTSGAFFQGRSPDIAGFTLLEMMVVVAIVAALAMVALPRLELGQGERLRTAVRLAVADLRILRDDAIRNAVSTALEPTANGYTLRPTGRKVTLPAGVTLGFAPPSASLLTDDRAEIIFFPDGSSTAGVISLQIRGAVVARISVAGIDGRATPDEQ
jgi:general secretion pathway protein H